MTERDVVVGAGFDFRRRNWRRAEAVGFLGEEAMRHRDIPSSRRRSGYSAERPVFGRVLDQGAAPDAGFELGKIEQRALRLQDQMKVARQQVAAEAGIERALVVRVMIAGDHYYR